MKNIIIGNGAAGLAAVKAFRKHDTSSPITIVSKEGGHAYSRVQLPYVLRGKVPYNNIFLPYEDEFEKLNVEHIEDEAVGLDDKTNTLMLAKSGKHVYDNLLIACGSRALWPPIKGINQPGIYHLWTREDLDHLIDKFNTCRKVFIIGSGLVSLQGAWTARCRGLDVTLVEIVDKLMPLVLDEKASSIMAQKMDEFGVEVFTSTITDEIRSLENDGFEIDLRDKRTISADFILVGAGVAANIDFIKQSGVEADRAIPVDNHMRTNISNIYAAGDAAAGPSAFGDIHVTHALWPTAVEMGTVAGTNMSGGDMAYTGSLNMNVTQMFGVTVASMGKFNDKDIDDSHVYDAEAGLGYCKLCYKDGYVVGMCLVGSSEAINTFGKLRPLIRKHLPVTCPPEKLDAFLNIRLWGK